MKQVLLIRHGATPGNLLRRYIGRTDEPLSPEGEAQALALRGKLPAPDALFVSPLLRARQTAALAFPGVKQTIVDELREMDFGPFEGRSADEMAADPVYRAWVDAFCETPIPGGEAPADFRARSAEAFHALLEALPEGATAAFVAHGGTAMAVCAAFCEPPRAFYDMYLNNGEALCGQYESGKLYLEERTFTL